MIKLTTTLRDYKIKWDGRDWRDEAGHVWGEQHEGPRLSFISTKHGKVTYENWRVI